MCIRLAWNNTQQSTGSFHVGKYACVSSDNPDDQIQPYKSTTASKQEEHHNTCSRQVSETQTRQPTTPSTRQSSKATVNTIDIPTCTAGGGYKQSHRRGVQADERPREWWPLQQTNEHRTRHKQPSNQTKRQPTGRSQTVTTLLTWANNQEWVLLDNELWWLRNYDDWGSKDIMVWPSNDEWHQFWSILILIRLMGNAQKNNGELRWEITNYLEDRWNEISK